MTPLKMSHKSNDLQHQRVLRIAKRSTSKSTGKSTDKITARSRKTITANSSKSTDSTKAKTLPITTNTVQNVRKLVVKKCLPCMKNKKKRQEKYTKR